MDMRMSVHLHHLKHLLRLRSRQKATAMQMVDYFHQYIEREKVYISRSREGYIMA